MGRFNGRVAVIAGGVGKIDLGIATRFGEEGAIVAIVDLDETAAAQTTAKLPLVDGAKAEPDRRPRWLAPGVVAPARCRPSGGPRHRRQGRVRDDARFRKDGTLKLVPTCTYPLTGVGCASRVYTNHGISKFYRADGAVKVVATDGVAVAELRELLGIETASVGATGRDR